MGGNMEWLIWPETHQQKDVFNMDLKNLVIKIWTILYVILYGSNNTEQTVLVWGFHTGEGNN